MLSVQMQRHLHEEVGTRVATVTTETLRVREDATTDSAILGLVPMSEELTVTDETDGFVKVSIEEGDGWVSKDYVDLRTDYVYAESKAEEEARLAKEEAEREAAQKAASAAIKKSQKSESKSKPMLLFRSEMAAEVLPEMQLLVLHPSRRQPVCIRWYKPDQRC